MGIMDFLKSIEQDFIEDRAEAERLDIKKLISRYEHISGLKKMASYRYVLKKKLEEFSNEQLKDLFRENRSAGNSRTCGIIRQILEERTAGL